MASLNRLNKRAKREDSANDGDVSADSGLLRSVFFVLIFLFFYRLGTYIPLPGIDVVAFSGAMEHHSGGVLGMLNMLTGGALGRMSVFALNIMPYITASIVIQLLSSVIEGLKKMKKEGEMGRRKINLYTKYLTIFIALFQGYGMAVGMESMSATLATSIVIEPGMGFRIIATLTLLGGSMFVVHLSDYITSRGIGNGSSLIIFSGIVSGAPSAIVSIFEMTRLGSMDVFSLISIVFFISLLVFLIIYVEKSQRRLAVQYPRRQVGNKIFAADDTYLPFRINTAGVIPPIFAGSILLFPITISNFISNDDSWLKLFISQNLSHGKPLYVMLFTGLICFFCFFYTAIVLNPDETAENLKKSGAILLNKRPGTQTASYIDYVLTRLTVIGALYISVVCVVPEILMSSYSVPFYLGGTSLLIVINVVIDVTSKIQTHFLFKKYSHMYKKGGAIFTGLR
ncbi:Protein translocase subunit SecY [Candidatus Cyrtobacter comes]|uniref:Protein translocase subunit SecY n=1 Tax=Candidatus Cyrtobacter comes TaxID=675776 RepID=A0ABU5L6I9_9RICK|nr:preprotein translocase subunit SecY [Candidatus Cyrtobacter comes]MDZ5761741.1 Protein translocase subunit SecY [Candidatus Cyrtobacter comes]